MEKQFEKESKLANDDDSTGNVFTLDVLPLIAMSAYSYARQQVTSAECYELLYRHN